MNLNVSEDSTSPNKSREESNSKGSDIKNFFYKKKNSKKNTDNLVNIKKTSISESNTNNNNTENDSSKLNNNNKEEKLNDSLDDSESPEKNKEFKNFVSSIRKPNNKENILKSKNMVSEELQSSHKMLLELNKIQCEFEDEHSKNKNFEDLDINEKKSNKSELKLQNKTSNVEEEMIKNEIYEDNQKSSKNNNDDKTSGVNNNDENKENKVSNEEKNEVKEQQDIKNQIKISISSDDEMEQLGKEVVNVLGERVFKAAYDIVYENVSV